MRITTRIALGLALLTGLMVGVLSYQLRTVDDLQRINEDLSRTNVEAARISIRLGQEIEGVREFAEKWLVLDSAYVEQWATWESLVAEDLERIRSLELGPRERQALRDAEITWQRYLFELAPLREQAPPVMDDIEPLRGRVHELMDEMRARAAGVAEANDAEIAARVEQSEAAGRKARRVASVSAVGAGLLGFLICVLLFLSISGPLRRLTRGTRAIAEGRFDHRLPADGGSELSELARDFNRMAARLDELEDMKRDFVSHVSHELKGPLAAIHETILVLLEQIPGPVNEKQAQLLALSRQSATRLSGMISNLLEVSRIEAGALILEPDWVEIGPMILDVREELTPLATERDLEVEIRRDTGPAAERIAADPERMREVVGNLLENAIKFSPPGATIVLGAYELEELPDDLPDAQLRKLEEKPPPFILVSVEDSGPGIPPEHREGVFEKFYQVKRGARVQGQGVGLGLAICRSVIEAHGGVIWASESESGGALFRFILPRVPSGVSIHRSGAPESGEFVADRVERAPGDAERAPAGASVEHAGTTTGEHGPSDERGG